MEPIFLVILSLALLVATYWDIRTREVPDTLSYGLIVVGLLGGLISALLQQQVSIFLTHLYGFVLGMVIGIVMFYTRQWGGGDAKLLMGIGAIIGFSFQQLDLIAFVLLLIFCGAGYGFAVTLYLALVKHRKVFLPAFKQQLRTPLVHRLRITLVIIGVAAIIAVFIVSIKTKLLLGLLLLGLYVLMYSWIFMRVVEKQILLKEYDVGKLTEGDWIVKEVKVGRRTIVDAKNTGVTKEQIEQLKKAKIKKVLVKEGIPFVPGFMLAFVVLLLLQYTVGQNILLKFIIG